MTTIFEWTGNKIILQALNNEIYTLWISIEIFKTNFKRKNGSCTCNQIKNTKIGKEIIIGSFHRMSKVKWSESHSVMSNSLWPHGLYSSWNSPGQNTGVDSHSLIQWFFPTWRENPGLPHCRPILYQLSTREEWPVHIQVLSARLGGEDAIMLIQVSCLPQRYTPVVMSRMLSEFEVTKHKKHWQVHSSIFKMDNQWGPTV